MPVLSPPKEPAATGTTGVVRGHRLDRFVSIGEWLLILALLVYAGGRVLPRAWNHLNTDFPNYYVTARLLREGSRTSRIYEWIWLQRQKDRMGITASDQPLVGFIPHTPFSSLLVWPLTYWSPLTAKRIWILANLALLGLVAVTLRSLTQLRWRHVALIISVCYPVLRNLEYGQYYVLLLALVSVSLFSYLKRRFYLAGLLMGIAGGLKIFPAFFFLYFLRKRNWHAAIGVALGTGLTIAASILAFGLELHRTYLFQVLPWALRGEAVDPYNLSANSFSSLLHRLFLFEPQWNPHPLMHAPAAFAILHPILQMAVLAPVILLIKSGLHRTDDQVRLEWSVFLLALLAISTVPASYHFTLLILPVAILTDVFLRQKQHAELVCLSLLYLAICFPAWPRGLDDGAWALLSVPRLYFMLLLVTLSYIALARENASPEDKPLERWVWAGALSFILLFQIGSALYNQRGMYDYNARISMSSDAFLATNPIASGDRVQFVAMLLDGYHVGSIDPSGTSFNPDTADQLAISASPKGVWIEEATRQSRIVHDRPNQPMHVEVDDAGVPVLSPDGKWLAYLRFTKGAGAIWLRQLPPAGEPDTLITPPGLDVEEMTFLPDSSLIFSAAQSHSHPALYRASLNGGIREYDSDDIRYPAASPDGHWLAYSRLQRGVYHLWLGDMRNGTTHQLTSAQCNAVSPAWHADSRTLLYASDCGRALGFTALYRKQVH